MHSHTVLARSVTELECYIYHRWFSGFANPFGRTVRFLSNETTQCIITHHWKIFSVAIFFIKSDEWKKHSLYDDHTWFTLDSFTFILNYSSNFLSLAVQWSFSPVSNFISFAHFHYHVRFNFLKTNDYVIHWQWLLFCLQNGRSVLFRVPYWPHIQILFRVCKIQSNF